MALKWHLSDVFWPPFTVGFIFYLDNVLISESLLPKEVRHSLDILDLNIESPGPAHQTHLTQISMQKGVRYLKESIVAGRGTFQRPPPEGPPLVVRAGCLRLGTAQCPWSHPACNWMRLLVSEHPWLRLILWPSWRFLELLKTFNKIIFFPLN